MAGITIRRNHDREEPWMPPVALVTNVLDFVGPPAVEALLVDGYSVYPGVTAIGLDEPAAIARQAWEAAGRIDVGVLAFPRFSLIAAG